MSVELEGKVALVTGAAQGIGLGVATALHDAGATVVLTDIDGDAVAAAADGLERGHALTVDASDEGQVAGAVDRVVADHGKLDIAVPNAGIAVVKPSVASSLEEWRKVTSVNLDGVFLLLRYAGAAMAGAGGGSIVTIGSVTAHAGSALIGSYAAAKAGAVNITKTFAVELRDAGVRCNAICPGFIDTELVTANKATFEELLGLPDFDAVIAAKQGRYGTVEEVAKLAVFLASDRASWCTGGAYNLDGGMRASLI